MRSERDRLRLDRAAQVILATKAHGEAARQAGYASPRQLAGPFRRRFGVTPSRMREISSAVRTVTWQAAQPPPYRGSWQQHPRRHHVGEAEPERLKYQPVENRERRAVFVARRGAVQHLRYSSSVLRQQPTKESIDE